MISDTEMNCDVLQRQTQLGESSFFQVAFKLHKQSQTNIWPKS